MNCSLVFDEQRPALWAKLSCVSATVIITGWFSPRTSVGSCSPPSSSMLCLCPGLWDERRAEAVRDLPPGGSAQRSRPPASGAEGHCQHFKVPSVQKTAQSRMRQQAVTFESLFTELFQASVYPPQAFHFSLPFAFSYFYSRSSIRIHSKFIVSCSVLSRLLSSVPVPFRKTSRKTPSWGLRTSCRW